MCVEMPLLYEILIVLRKHNEDRTEYVNVVTKKWLVAVM